MRILNFGSMNLDYVYTVQDIARAGKPSRPPPGTFAAAGKD